MLGLSVIDIIVIVLYLGAVTTAGLRAARSVKDSGDFFEERYGKGAGGLYTFNAVMYFAVEIGMILLGTRKVFLGILNPLTGVQHESVVLRPLARA